MGDQSEYVKMSSGGHFVLLKDHIVIGSKEILKAFSLQDGTIVFCYHHQFDKKAMDGNEKPLEEKMEDICVANDGEHIAVIYSDKKFVVINSKTWTVVWTAAVNRRPTAVTFQPDNEQILVADKSGGLYRYNVTQNPDQCDVDTKLTSENGDDTNDAFPPVLAHVSMLLDVKTDEKYIYTADRDEKIRMSQLSQPYVIENYCLGHTEFVCRIQPLRIAGEPFLLSVSGDSTVRLWDVKSGKELMDLDVSSKVPIEKRDPGKKLLPSILSVRKDCGSFLVSFNQSACPCVLVFQLDASSTNFAFQESFEPAGCKIICDVKFSVSDHIYVLSVSTESETLNLQLYARNSGVWQCVDDSSAVARITSELKSFRVDKTAEWELLYKARGDGQVYNSYFKRKAERLLTRNGQDDHETDVTSKCTKLAA